MKHQTSTVVKRNKMYLTASSSLFLATFVLHCGNILASSSSNGNVWGITSGDSRRNNNNSRPKVTTAFTIPKKTVASSRDNLLSYAEQLNSKSGPFLRDVESMKQLKKKVAELEAVCDAPILSNVEDMVGDWKLLCTTDSIERRERSKGKFPFPLPGFLKESIESNPLEKNIRNSVQVIQRIRKDEGNDNGSLINRVDNVIEFIPLTFTDVLPSNIADSLNLNPLEVTKSKVSLIHTAEVQSVSPLLRTKIALKSVVLNVAGESQFLEPEGDDFLGLNVPFGDLTNFGSFDTTYVDDTLRISRGKTGFAEQLRVFIREDTKASEVSLVDDVDDKGEGEQQELPINDEISSVAVLDDNEEIIGTDTLEENENASRDDVSTENNIVGNKDEDDNGDNNEPASLDDSV